MVVCHQGVRLTYAEFQSRVSQTAKGLMALGVRKGDRVGIWAFNCEEWVLTQFATAAIGAILVNINPAYGTRELAYALKQSGAHTLLFQPHFKRSNTRAERARFVLLKLMQLDPRRLEALLWEVCGLRDYAEAAQSITDDQWREILTGMGATPLDAADVLIRIG